MTKNPVLCTQIFFNWIRTNYFGQSRARRPGRWQPWAHHRWRDQKEVIFCPFRSQNPDVANFRPAAASVSISFSLSLYFCFYYIYVCVCFVYIYISLSLSLSLYFYLLFGVFNIITFVFFCVFLFLSPIWCIYCPAQATSDTRQQDYF